MLLRSQALVGGFFHRRLLSLHQLDIQAQRLQFAHKHVERLRHARFDARLALDDGLVNLDRKSTRLNSSHPSISYAVFCLKKKTEKKLYVFTPLLQAATLKRSLHHEF